MSTGVLIQNYFSKIVWNPFAMGGESNFDHTNSEEQILPEASLIQHFAQIAIPGSTLPGVHWIFFLTTQWLDSLLLKRTKQRLLNTEGMIAILIKEEGTTIRSPDDTFAIDIRSRKGPLFITKKHASRQGLGYNPKSAGMRLPAALILFS